VVACPIVPSQTYVEDFTVEFQVQNGGELLSGYHPYRARLHMQTRPDWYGNMRGLFCVLQDGSLMGLTGQLGHMVPGRW
jgi:hypothetical protein